MKMRPSRVLRKLRAGETVLCTKLNLGDPRAAEIAALCGFDCIWICMEHVPTDWQTVENQIRAAKAYDVDVVVRVARGSYSDLIRPLQADAAGIMVPHIMGLEDAKNVVRQTRFHPIGRRPVDGGNADGKYCMIDFVEYLRQANEQRFVIVQVEDPEPLDQLDEIAKLEGIDMILLGPADLSHGLGVPGQWDHPRIAETRKRVAEACIAHGKFPAAVATLDNLEEILEMGYRFVNIGADVLALSSYYKDIIARVSEIRGKII